MVAYTQKNIGIGTLSRILVVDDSIVARRMIQFALRDFDCELLEAEDGAQAWELLQTIDIDLLITDLYMPQLNGLELVGRLRDAGHMTDLPIILLTSETDAQQEMMARRAGVSLFMNKPFQPEQLAGLVRQVFA